MFQWCDFYVQTELFKGTSTCLWNHRQHYNKAKSQQEAEVSTNDDNFSTMQ